MIEWLFAIPAAYQAIALAAVASRLRKSDPQPSEFPIISILKPVRGIEIGFYEAIRSHAEQDYPRFEIIFAVNDASDPALAEVKRLIKEFPERSIRYIVRQTDAANRKVGSLIDLATIAHGELILVNDADIHVPDGYLRSIVGAMQSAGNIGLVTCLYKARAAHAAGWFEALGVAADFAPSALVAPFVGISEFALGSTMLFRRADLDAMGGFAAVADYIADDYHLGLQISKLGKRVHFSTVIVETALGARTIGEAWSHQVRWARTIRASRGDLIGYLGLPVTFATLWSILAAACGWWTIAEWLFSLRAAVALASAGPLLADFNALRNIWMLPLRDLWAAAIWVAGISGRKVEWGGEKLTLTKNGRIVE